ncbi:MAG: hypothetical protein E6J91_19190 [Deltaproteobacteria bacterium]|nr:MAG: hypothetical protein E6J91_19190 [Deltaproteobacteria bacterium]
MRSITARKLASERSLSWRVRRRSTIVCRQVNPAPIASSAAAAISAKNQRFCHHAGSTANRSSAVGPQVPPPIRARASKRYAPAGSAG